MDIKKEYISNKKGAEERGRMNKNRDKGRGGERGGREKDRLKDKRKSP